MNEKARSAIARHGVRSSQAVAAEHEAILDGKGLDDLPDELRRQLIDHHTVFRAQQDEIVDRHNRGEISAEAKTQALASLRLQAIRRENELLGAERFQKVYGLPLADLLDLDENR